MAKKLAIHKDTYQRKMPDGSTQTRGFNPIPLQTSKVARKLHGDQGWVKVANAPIGVEKAKPAKEKKEPEFETKHGKLDS
jgi:hypothetical protein